MHLFETHCAFLPCFNPNLDFLQAVKLQNLAIICCMTEQVRGMGLFLGGRHRLICIVISLCKHACKEVCDVKQGIDPYPLLARSCNKWWPDFVTFTACKKLRFEFKRGKQAQCISNRCKTLFEWEKYFGVRCTLRMEKINAGLQTTKLKSLATCKLFKPFNRDWAPLTVIKVQFFKLSVTLFFEQWPPNFWFTSSKNVLLFRSHRCPQHSDEQRQSVRLLLLGTL